MPGTYTPLVRAQVEYALAEADMVLFVIDAITGITAADREVADLLRRTAKPVLLLANKAENREREEAAVAFYELGLGEPIPISAHHGHGVADVMDMIVDSLPPSEAGGRDDRAAAGDRRAAERRQVVAGERDPGRGARDRERRAGHDARRHRHAVRCSKAIRWCSSTRPGCGGAARSSRASRSIRRCGRGGRWSGRRWRCACSTSRRGSRRRTRTSSGTRWTRSAAWSWWRTSGTW